jgi:two-component sensor histidine kinase
MRQNTRIKAIKAESSGRIRRGVNDTIELSVRDQGRGVPANFDLSSAPGLGMRIIHAFAQQLRATIEVHCLDPGTEFIAIIPP